MAELLIYNKIHWFALLTLKEQETYDEKEFLGCYKKGDVVNVQPDGHYYNRGQLRNCDLESFCVVATPGKIEDFNYLLEGDETSIDSIIYTRRRKRNIAEIQLASNINDVEVLNVEEKDEWQPLTSMSIRTL